MNLIAAGVLLVAVYPLQFKWRHGLLWAIWAGSVLMLLVQGTDHG